MLAKQGKDKQGDEEEPKRVVPDEEIKRLMKSYKPPEERVKEAKSNISTEEEVMNLVLDQMDFKPSTNAYHSFLVKLLGEWNPKKNSCFISGLGTS